MWGKYYSGDMLICRQCNEEFKYETWLDNTNCPNCGSHEVNLMCPFCGHEVDEDLRFCCGDYV